jgi:hypothetical protein
MYHSVSNTWQAQRNTSIQDLWYIYFNYSSLLSCADHVLDSVSDSNILHQEEPSAIGQLKLVLKADLRCMLLVLIVECDALLQWQIGIAVHWCSRWPNTCLQPVEHSVPFLVAPLVPLQLLEAALALALGGNGWDVAAPCFSAPDPAT